MPDLSGKWRGEFILRDKVVAPFNFEIDHDGKVYLLNASEKFETGAITIKKDSAFIALDQFDNELAFKVNKNTLQGVFRRQDHAGTPASVIAEKGKTFRFKTSKPASRDFSGRYDVVFQFESGKKETCVALFEQSGNDLTGTFLKPSGDARYLQGSVEGNKFYLSSFIGSSPGYYEGTITEDGKISGIQLGTKIKNKFAGSINNKAELEDAFGVARLKPSISSIDFSFPDINGNLISPKDEKYKNKVLIIPITGTWCPNCIDEAAFLSPWYNKNKDRGVEIITIHYERQSDTAFVHKVMRRFRNRFAIEYDQVFGGSPNNDSVLKSLPALQTFKSFPTTIFVDRNGNVSKIHSGFSGPATGKFYDDLVKEFNEEIDKLLEK